MSDATYAVIRYTPDPARNEALNIGILAWQKGEPLVRVDDDAVARVVRENPQLETDALMYVEQLVRNGLQGVKRAADVEHVLTEQRGFPISFSEPRHTTVVKGADLGATMDRLVQRIVAPRRRGGGGGGNPADAVSKQLKALKAAPPVMRNYFIDTTTSGAPRAVDFFVNHGANRALDVLRLAVSRADEIRRRADAEAFKVWDVTQKNNVTYTVLCDLSPDRQLSATYDTAKRAIEAGGATVVTDPEEAVEALVGDRGTLL